MKQPLQQRLVKALAGLAAFALVFGLLAYGPIPKGKLGLVIRNNQAKGIDATPLLYTELDNYDQLEASLRREMWRAEERRQFKQRSAASIRQDSSDTAAASQAIPVRLDKPGAPGEAEQSSGGAP